MLINLHRLNTNNVGDLRCAPALYFQDRLPMQRIEILGFSPQEAPEEADRMAWTQRVENARAIILGGGGLLNIDFFEPALTHISSIKRVNQKIIIWGAGHNAWIINDWRELKPNISLEKYNFDLIGIRDDNQPFDWVPCVSCMDPIFTKSKTSKYEIGLYAHVDTIKTPDLNQRLPVNLPTLDNSASFDEAISFIGDCEMILTDSYHGVYWATLLGKRVIAFPSSSKFYDFRHPVPLCDPSDWKRYRRVSVAYPEALAECRDANERFANKVAALVQ